MTDKELIDGFLAGELDDAGMAQLESELAARPELLHELAEQQQMEMALDVLLGDETADQQVTVSVLGVLRGKSLDQFKTDLLKKVQAEDLRKKKEDEAVRVPTTSSVPILDEPASRARSSGSRARRGWTWGAAASIAAALLVALAWGFLRSPSAETTENRTAFLLSTTPGVKVHRGAQVLPAAQYMLLEPGDRIVTGDGDRLQMGFPADTTRLELKGSAVLGFIQGGKAKRLDLSRGEIDAAVAPQEGGQPLVVGTPHSELRIDEAHVRFVSAADFARAEVRKGQATLVRRPDGKSVRLSADQYAVAGKGVDLVAKAIEAPGPGAAPSMVAVVRAVQGEAFLFTQSPADRTPLRAGQGISAAHGIVTGGARSRVTLEYPDQTRLELDEDTVIRRFVSDDGSAKNVRLEAGAVTADVVKQPAGRPMKLVTAHAEAGVLGTRFILASEKEITRIHVEEGAVEFTRAQDRKSVVVRSGYFAVAAPGRPLEPAPVPGGIRYLDIDLSTGVSEGGGHWKVEGRSVAQERAAADALSSHLFRIEPVEEGALLEATVEVSRVAPASAGGQDPWGFGLAAIFGEKRIVLNSNQGGAAGSVLEFEGARAIPFEHGQEGRYRLKLRVERRGDVAVLQGKLWQGEREPVDWAIEDEVELQGRMTQVGFQAARCACVFSSFRVKVLKADSR